MNLKNFKLMLKTENISQEKLAKTLNMCYKRLNAILNGRIPLTQELEMALILHLKILVSKRDENARLQKEYKKIKNKRLLEMAKQNRIQQAVDVINNNIENYNKEVVNADANKRV